MQSIYPVVLSGGSGTRLWPLSRAMYPKQFIRFFESQVASFLAATVARLTSEEGFARPIVVCNNDHRFLVKDEIDGAGVTPAGHRSGTSGAQHRAAPLRWRPCWWRATTPRASWS